MLKVEKELYEINIGTKLYIKRKEQYKEVEVYKIFLESYINGWKTIIKVKDGNLLYTYYASDIGNVLFTKIPNEEN